MAFTPENVQRNELVRFDLESVIRAPGNGAELQKRGYKFTVENRGNFFDWFNAFFELQLKRILKRMEEKMLMDYPQLLMVHIHLLSI